MFAATGALATEPAAPLIVSKNAAIAAPPASVWATIGKFADLTWITSIVKASSATDGNTVGSVRTLDLGGPKLTEKLTAYDGPGMSYGYTIIDTPENRKIVPVSDYHSTLTVRPGADGGSLVSWEGRFERADTSEHPAAGQDDAAAVKAISGIYSTGLADLAKKFAK